METDFLPTTGSTTEQNEIHRNDPDRPVHVLVLSSVVPVCTFIFMFVLIRRAIIRRRTRLNRIVLMTQPIYVISQPAYQLRQLHERSVPDIERVTNQKSVHTAIPKEKHVKKEKPVKNVNAEKKSPVNLKFPREPVYRSQQTPSYLVPFTALPPNFDFSHANVDVHSDFVIIKDLDILQTYWYEIENSKEEYKKQTPFNSNFIK